MSGSQSRESGRNVAIGLLQAAIVLVGGGWVPVLGPALAGLLVSRRLGGTVRGGLAAGAVVALLAFAALRLVSLRDVSLGGTQVGLGPLALVAPAVAVAVIAGACLGVRDLGVRAAGVLVLGISVWMYWVQGAAIWNLAKTLVPQKSDAPVAAQGGCTDRLKALNTALMLYSDSWDGALPPADRWFTAIKDNLKDEKVAGCPDAGNGSLGYAMSDSAGGKDAASLAKGPRTVVLYEVEGGGPDQHGDPAKGAGVGRHRGAGNALFSDGTAGPRK